MFDLNTLLKYPLLLILSTGKRNFSELARMANESVYSIKKAFSPSQISLKILGSIAQFIFKNPKKLVLAVDDTLIQKIYSRCMVGSSRFFDTKIGRRVIAYRMIVAVLTNGKSTIPIGFGFMFAKELFAEDNKTKSKLDFIELFISSAKKLFPQAQITLVLDGLFASVEILGWAKRQNIRLTVRMHSNRKILYNEQLCKINKIAKLIPKGRQKACSIRGSWHDLELFITAERRIDKCGEESIVYLASTYKAKPIEHVEYYKKRWPIEKMFRTCKQLLGLGDCASTSLEIQENHVAACLVAYALAQLAMRKQKLETPEKAIRSIRDDFCDHYLNQFNRFGEIFEGCFA